MNSNYVVRQQRQYLWLTAAVQLHSVSVVLGFEVRLVQEQSKGKVSFVVVKKGPAEYVEDYIVEICLWRH